MKRLILPLALVMFATGCAASTPAATPTTAPTEAAATASPTPVTLGPGEYEFQPLTGGAGALSLPGKPAADLEALRAIVKGAPVTYLTATVDNREGTADFLLTGVSLFTPDGDEVKYQTASEYADTLNKKLAQDAPAETYNKFVEAYNKHNDPIKTLAKGTVTLVGPKVPAEFTGVKVYSGGEAVDALPKS